MFVIEIDVIIFEKNKRINFGSHWGIDAGRWIRFADSLRARIIDPHPRPPLKTRRYYAPRYNVKNKCLSLDRYTCTVTQTVEIWRISDNKSGKKQKDTWKKTCYLILFGKKSEKFKLKNLKFKSLKRILSDILFLIFILHIWTISGEFGKFKFYSTKKKTLCQICNDWQPILVGMRENVKFLQ